MKQASLSRRAVWAAPAVVFALLSAGCAAGEAEPPAGDSGDTRAVEHLLGSTDVPTDPERVVAVSVTSTPILLGLDLPVVAAGTTSPSALTDGNGFFAQWADVAEERGVEPLPGPEVDLEAVASAEPDVIVGTGFGADAVDERTYERLSEIAPTVVFGSSDTPWLDVTEEVAAAFGAEARAEEIAAEYTDLTEETAAALDTGKDVVLLTGTPTGFNVFTEESPQGRFLADLGLRQHAFEDGETTATEGRADTVSVSPENVSSFDDSTLLFVNTKGEKADDYLETAPNLARTPAFEEDRAFTIGAEAFRMDPYSVRVVAERLTDLIGA
ncbi:Fe2+-enterobactin ABC transporter substrate-binding protein [Nocardiopsis trehalosi]|jgi:iron complex transport system substrate-binding protein|uniref:Fe2+-enterobactin ABC transporter substrate-binding protein n=1 Tax=Nocardiopsis trehalosi TaxID=109329 RepID=UPI00157E060D|nr:Fe2+-enterobactin ABC transporter substrate-binding protein [Nocardiopsis trehalosi]